MIYASIEDIWKRKGTDISDTDYVMALLEDAAIIIDAYNRNATDEAKKLVSCNMVIRFMIKSPFCKFHGNFYTVNTLT